MLTTTDNPYSPFDQFEQWQLYDIEKQYFCCELLARIVHLEEDMSEKEKEEAIDRAIDEIVKNDLRGIYARANENDTFPLIPQ